jgi:hypothetical protein
MAITTVKIPQGGVISKATYLDPVVDDLTAIDLATQTLKFATGQTTDSAAIGAETMVSSPATSFVWKAGRAYKLTLTGRVSVSVANTEAIFKFRRGTTTGATLLADLGSIKVVTVGNVQHVNLTCYVKNATGADITTTVQPSLAGGGGNVVWSGTAIPRGWMIEDAGPASIMGALAADI